MSVPAPRLEILRDQVDELLRVLAEENAALGQSDLKQLDPVLAKKQRLLTNLASFTADELEAARGETDAWGDFAEKLSLCQERNLVNGATMTEMLKMRQGALRIFMGRSAET